jgi:hypothetical protein
MTAPTLTDAKCDHEWRWIDDWYGDPTIPNGTQDCSRLECTKCGEVDPDGERPEADPDDRRDAEQDERCERAGKRP